MIEQRTAKKVLLVEDERIIAMTLENTLRRHGFTPFYASSGAMAIAVADENNPDFILMDIILKGEMDGITAVEQIKSRHDVPIIYLTAHSDDATLARAKQTNPHGYLLKPINENELFSTIEIALYKHGLDIKIRESEARLSLMLNSLPMAFYTADVGSTYGGTWVSNQIDSICGFSPDDFMEDRDLWSRRLHPDDRERALASFDAIFTENRISTEYRWQGADGRYRWFLDNAILLRDRDDSPKEILGTWLDVTERKHADEALNKSEETYRSIFNGTTEAIIIRDIDTGRILDVNQPMLDMYGLTYQAALGLTVLDLSADAPPVPQAIQKDGQEFMSKAIEEGPQVFEWLAKRNNGELFWIEVALKKVRIGGEDRLMSVIRDISGRKESAEALRRSEERLLSFINSAADGFFLLDSGMNLVEINERGLEIVNMTRDAVTGHHISEISPAVYQSEHYEHLRKVIDTGVPYIADDYIHHPKFGDLYVQLKAFKVGDFLGVITADITERIQMEKALHESEERYRAFFEESADPVMIFNEREFLDCNSATLDMFCAQDKKELVGLHPSDISPPFQPDGKDSRIAAHEQILLAMEKGSNKFEWIHRRVNGEDFYAEVMLTAFKIQDQQFIQSVLRDITDRKRAEAELRLMEERFSKAFMFGPQLMAITALEDGKVLEVNDRFLETAGYSREEVLGHTPMELGFYSSPEERAIVVEMLKNNESVRNHPIRFRTKSGEERWGSLSMERINIDNKNCILTFMDDITETRMLQQEMSNMIEMERQRIGRDLHDDLGQDLTGATFLIQSLKEELRSNGSGDYPALEKIDGLIRNAVTKTRVLSRMLSPVEMDEGGFLSAVETMAAQAEDVFAIICQVIPEGDILVEDNQVATHLYYIARESVNNAVKHGNAQHIDIYLDSGESRLTMRIEDNGSGIQHQGGAQGLGLRLIKYRADMIGAQASFDYNRPEGFAVTLVIPL